MLEDIRILDLSRILAGPWATQLLADLGAEVIKVERPGSGDDTRGWGPPFVADTDGGGGDAAYFLAANRNKRSIAVDFAQPEGAALLRRLCRRCDVLVENFRPGGLAPFGLDHDSLVAEQPELIYCSITGFGQTGPERERPGYDAMIQAMTGLMSVTGEAEGPPQKVGVAVSDLMTGMYAAVAILGALHERQRSGRGRHIDLALFDCQLAAMANQAMSYLAGGGIPARLGSAHPSIVPYQPFRCSDGWLMLAVGNDRQFARWCRIAGCEDWVDDARFASNAARVAHRGALIDRMAPIMAAHDRGWWQRELDVAGIPAGPVQDLGEAWEMPQVRARGMRMEAIDGSRSARIYPGNPISRETRCRPAPRLGEHGDAILAEAGLAPADVARLRALGVLG